MPSFTMHMAIAKQYIRKHKSEIINEVEFIKGSIAPDLEEDMKTIAKDKNKTHYGQWNIWPIEINYNNFLKDSRVNLNQDFWKGYLLHLLTDEYFYTKTFSKETQYILENNDSFYEDYTCLNKDIMEKYNIDLIEDLKKYMTVIQAKTKYLEKDRIISFIEEVSNLNLDEEIEKIKERSCI